MRVRVIGVGSPFGDDAVGLHVARRLAQVGVPPGVEVLERDRPGLALVDDLRDAELAWIVDAVASDMAPGTLLPLAPDALALPRAASSHGLGVAESLALARALGRALPRVRLLGIAIARPVRGVPGDALSAPVAAAVGPACALVRRALARDADQCCARTR